MMLLSRAKRIPRAEAGGVAVAVLFLAPLVSGFVWLAVFTGKVNVEQQHLQHAVDSMALTVAAAVRDQGLPISGTALSQDFSTVAQVYGNQPVDTPTLSDWGYYDASNRRIVEVRATHRHAGLANWMPTAMKGTATAFASINEQRLSEDLWKPIVLVVEVSVPTMWPVKVNGKKLKVLDLIKAAVDAYAKKRYPARNGLVVYASKGFTTETSVLPPPNQNRDQVTQANRISTRLGLYKGAPNFSMTNIAVGLEKAASFLRTYRSPGREQTVVLISPGLTKGSFDHNSLKSLAAEMWHGPGEMAMRQGNSIRTLGPRGTSLATIQLMYKGNLGASASKLLPSLLNKLGISGNQLEDELMRGLAGGPKTNGGDARFHFQLDSLINIPKFIDRMRQIVCRYGPRSIRAASNACSPVYGYGAGYCRARPKSGRFCRFKSLWNAQR